MVLTETGRGIIAVNRALEESSGFQPEELVGRPLDVLIDASSLAWLERHWLALDRVRSFAGTLNGLRSDGGRVRVQFAARRETIGGRDVVLAVQLDHGLNPLSLAAAHRSGPGALTPRELEIVAGIAMGQRGPEIARDLSISPETVRTHVRNAMAKLGTRSQAQLVAVALTTGTLDLARTRELAEGHPDSA